MIINLAFLSFPAPHSGPCLCILKEGFGLRCRTGSAPDTLGAMELPDVTGNFKSSPLDL